MIFSRIKNKVIMYELITVSRGLILAWTLVSQVICSVPQFSRFQSGYQLQKVAIDPLTGYIFAAGKNTLHRFSPDLSERLTMSTGPVLDSVSCNPDTISSCSGLTLHDNDARMLEIDPDTNKLIFCGSVHQGLCSVFYPESLTLIQNMSTSNPVNYIGSRQSTCVFYGRGGGGEESTSVLYVANTYDGRPMSISQPALSARKLQVNNYRYDMAYVHENRSTDERSAIMIHSYYRSSYLIKYIYGFEYNGFTYFLTLQRQSVDITSSYSARLVRVCQNDHGFYSYTELQLLCRKQNGVITFFNVPQAAYLETVGEDMRTRMGAYPGEKILYVAFGISKEDNDTADPSAGTGLCTYRMSKIEQSFQTAQKNCYKGTGGLLEWIKPDQDCHKDLKLTIMIDNEFCGTPLNVGIDSRYSHQPSDSGETETRVTTPHLVTSLAITTYKQKTIAIMGTATGEILKMLVAERKKPAYAVIPVGRDLSQPAVASDMAFDETKSNIYVLTGNVITRVPLESCSVYKTCSECVLSLDPLDCGWCNNRCTRNEECTGNFSPESCPPILKQFEPRSGPLSGGTLLTISGQYFGNSNATVQVAYQPCEIQHRNTTSIVCRTSNAPVSTEREIRIDVTDMTKRTESFNIRGSANSKHMSFSYKRPAVQYFTPHVGPKSGGTQITVYGQNLDIGSNLTVYVASRPCDVQSCSADKIICLTSAYNPNQSDNIRKRELPAPEEHGEGTVNISIDSARLVVNGGVFAYEDDPIIDSIYPQYSIMSGGFPITVEGSNLHIISNPQVEAVVQGGDGTKYYESCTASPEGQTMICYTPNISTTPVFVLPEEPLEVDISLLLDNVSPPSATFNYSIDPVIYPFRDGVAKFYKDAIYLAIQGAYIDFAAEEENVDVLFDSDKCNVTKIGMTVIVCKPDRPDPEKDQDMWKDVTVKIGNRHYTVGRLQFSNQRTDLIIVTVAAPILSGAVILLIIICLVWMKKTKRGVFRKVMPHEANVRYARGTAEIGPSRDQQMYRLPVENRYWSETPQILRQHSFLPVAREPIMDDESRRLIEDNRLMIGRDTLRLLDIIGQGHFGCVYRGLLKINDSKEEQEVAVKTLKSLTENTYTNSLDAKKFLDEALRMREFKHPRILRLIGIALDKEDLPLVVLPFMKHGDLLSYIRNEAHSPTVKNLIDFGIQIAEGMAYLSTLKFVHRDLAARNCMLDDTMNVKVADFGLSRDIYERDYYSSDDRKAKLPVKWMAIESLEKGIYNTKTDVWSYGVVLWELMTRGVCPYPDVDNWDIIKYLKLGRRMPQPAYCPDPLYAIMLNCWDVDPKQRPTFNELVHNVKSIIITMQQMQQKVGIVATYVNVPTSQGYLYPQPSYSSAMSTLV